MTLKLYGAVRSRASIIQWYLEELGVPYELVMLDFPAGENRQPEYLAINPTGKVPSIVDGDLKLWESGAILLYLAEKYGGTPLSVEERSLTNQWILFSNATLGPGIFMESSREREMPKLFGALNQHFETHTYVMGDQFSAADAAVGSMLAYIPLMLKIGFDDYPAIAAYVKRLYERPAFQKTIGSR